MDLIVLRGRPILPLAQPGEMTLQGNHAAWTLENYPDRIPVGRYKVAMYPSPHFGRLMPMVTNVPGRSDILIHWGTFPQNYEGCIGVGELRDPATGEIFNTQKKWQELVLPIEAAIASEGCWITVQDPPGGPQTFLDTE